MTLNGIQPLLTLLKHNVCCKKRFVCTCNSCTWSHYVRLMIHIVLVYPYLCEYIIFIPYFLWLYASMYTSFLFHMHIKKIKCKKMWSHLKRFVCLWNILCVFLFTLIHINIFYLYYILCDYMPLHLCVMCTSFLFQMHIKKMKYIWKSVCACDT